MSNILDAKVKQMKIEHTLKSITAAPQRESKDDVCTEHIKQTPSWNGKTRSMETQKKITLSSQHQVHTQ